MSLGICQSINEWVLDPILYKLVVATAKFQWEVINTVHSLQKTYPRNKVCTISGPNFNIFISNHQQQQLTIEKISYLVCILNNNVGVLYNNIQ